MAMEVKIHKKLGEYELDVHWKSTKKRIGILGASGSGKKNRYYLYGKDKFGKTSFQKSQYCGRRVACEKQTAS